MSAEPPNGLLAGQVISDRYRIVRPLGAGGMGLVYEAEHLAMARTVALKVIQTTDAPSAQLVERFEREVQISARLEHPNVVRLYDCGTLQEGSPYLVMERLHGEDLASRMERVQRLGAAEAVAIATGLLRGLEAVHAEGIIHRDLKPANVMLCDGPQNARVVKLLDFGIALLSEEARVSKLGSVVGTPSYLSPEQARGLEIDVRSDLYSVGVVLYEMLTGRVPFHGCSAIEVLLKHVNEPPVPPSQRLGVSLPADFEVLVLALLAKHPDARPDSAACVLELLEGMGELRGASPIKTVTRDAPSADVHDTIVEAPLGLVDTIDISRVVARPDPELLVPNTVVVTRELQPGWQAPNAFVGREAELAQIADHFQADARLVTLHGFGGAGKTRLAREFGALDNPERQVVFVDLTDASTIEGVCLAVARALDLPLTDADPVAQVGRVLRGYARLLLILDNFEQVAHLASVTVTPWLEGSPSLRLIVTSRELLRIHHEQVLPLGPLAVPAAAAALDAGALPDFSAAALFLARAREIEPRFTLTEDNAQDVASIVRALDGIPLAIELAVARLRVMSAGALSKAMGRRFQLLTGGQAGAPARQATLRGTIDWSWDLLSDWERAALAQCSVFRDGFTLDAAEAVLDLAAWPEAPWCVDVIQALVDKSLLRPLDSGGELTELRFVTYESIRAYASEKLAGPDAVLTGDGASWSGSEAEGAAFTRHAAWFAERCGPVVVGSFYGQGGVAVFLDVRREQENLFVATERAIEASDGRLASRCYLGLQGVMEVEGGPYAPLTRLFDQLVGLELEEGDRLALLAAGADLYRSTGDAARCARLGDEALSFATRLSDRDAECRVRFGLGALARERGHLDEAQRLLEESLAIARSAALPVRQGVALRLVGTMHIERGEPALAEQALEEALEINRDVGNIRLEGKVLNSLAILRKIGGRVEEARALFDEALALHRRLGDRRSEGAVLSNIGDLYLASGDLEPAMEHFERAAKLLERTGYASAFAIVLINMGTVYQRWRRYDEARGCLERSIATLEQCGLIQHVPHALRTLAEVLREVGQPEEALRHLEDADSRLVKQGNARERAAVLSDIGLTLRRLGRVTEALDWLERGLALHRQVGNRSAEGTAVGRIAEVLQALGRTEDAGSRYEEALVILEEVGDLRGLGLALNNRADLARHAGRHQEALDFLARARAVHRRTGHCAGEAVVLINMALCARAEGQTAEALRACGQALEVLSTVSVPYVEGIAHAHLARLALEAEELTTAHDHSVQAVSMHRDLGASDHLVEALAIRGCVDVAEGRASAAARALEEARTVAATLDLAPDAEVFEPLETLAGLLEG